MSYASKTGNFQCSQQVAHTVSFVHKLRDFRTSQSGLVVGESGNCDVGKVRARLLMAMREGGGHVCP